MHMLLTDHHPQTVVRMSNASEMLQNSAANTLIDSKGRCKSDELKPPVSLDKHFPIEVWHHICSYLYPSQLSRLSRASKTLDTIVGSHPMWSKLFSLTFGPNKRLRLLVTRSESESYLLYLCASSLHICENCRGLTSYNRVVQSELPLPTLVPMPTRSTKEIEYLGEKLNVDWTIRMCLACRKLQPAEPTPRNLIGAKMSALELQKLYPGYRPDPATAVDAHSLQMQPFGGGFAVPVQYFVKDALTRMRQVHGGDVGVAAAGKSAMPWDDKTIARIRWYRLQD